MESITSPDKFKQWEKRLSGISLEENVEDKFKEIADDLFSHFYIKRGKSGVEYRFLEVEFYYNSPNHWDGKKDSNDLFVYERCNAETGEFFLHDSGVDICFKGTVLKPNNVEQWGDNDTKELKGGGILIRSLLRIEGKQKTIVAGPFDCADVLFNYTSIETMPLLCYRDEPFIEESDIQKNRIENTYRCHVAGKTDLEKAKYCFYDSAYVNVKDNKWIDAEDKEPLERYHPRYRKSYKNTYSQKPWNY